MISLRADVSGAQGATAETEWNGRDRIAAAAKHRSGTD